MSPRFETVTCAKCGCSLFKHEGRINPKGLVCPPWQECADQHADEKAAEEAFTQPQVEEMAKKSHEEFDKYEFDQGRAE